jgi:multidrug efflux system membrane fusion protein
MAKLSRSLATLAVLLVACGAAYLTRDKWQSYAPQWLNAYLPAANAARTDAPQPNAGAQPQRQGGGRRGGSFDTGPIPVLATAPKTADVPVNIDGVGTVKALNTVTMTPQVSGQIVDLPFKEGQDVKKGSVIARIDDSTYKAALDQAVAKRAQDQAVLDNARLDLERYIGLVANNSVTKQTADTQRATVAQNEAQVKSDDAAIASAKATLAYTIITAPIDGRTGIRNVDIGNVVQASSSTGIVTLTQIKPIAVVFNVPQQYLQQIARAKAAGELRVQALGGNNSRVVDTGTLDVIDNEVDSTTGTIRLKALFPNDSETLWPGAFVNARLLVQTIKDAIVVPTAAVQRGPNGPFLYILTDDNKAQMRPVTVGQQGDIQSVVTDGLKLGEKVITSGFARLTDGAKVEVSAPATTAADGTVAPSESSGVGSSVGGGTTAEGGSVKGPAGDGGTTTQPDDASPPQGQKRQHNGKHHPANGGQQNGGQQNGASSGDTAQPGTKSQPAP